MDVVHRSPRSRRGITLVELITTLAVASVFLAVLIPGWRAFSASSQITTAANSLLTDLRFARNAAVTQNRRIGLCPTEDGDSCSGDPHGWQDGYLIFVDRNRNRSRDAGEHVLRKQHLAQNGLRLHSTAGRPAINFRPDGAAWSTNTTFSVCLGDKPDNYRAVVLYGTGRARVDRRTPAGRRVRCS